MGRDLNDYTKDELSILYKEFRRIANLARHLGVRKEAVSARLDKLGITKKPVGHPRKPCPFTPDRLRRLFEGGGVAAVAREAKSGWMIAKRWCEEGRLA